MAIKTVQGGPTECFQVVFFDRRTELMDSLKVLTKTHRVSLQWIPAHCGTPGNEAAAQLAKEDAKSTQPEMELSYHDKKSIIKTIFRTPRCQDDYHILSREDQMILFRLRTGHNRLNYRMNRKFKLAPTADCTCHKGDQTVEHILQLCPRLRVFRDDVWAAPTTVETKLHGNGVNLKLKESPLYKNEYCSQ